MSFRYQVHFTRDLFAPGNTLLRDVAAEPDKGPKKMLLIVDRGVYRHHPRVLVQAEEYARRHRDAVTLAARPVVVEGGETAKNDPTWIEIVHKAVEKAGLCRHSYVAAVGGGAVIDMAGFAAATAHRGIRLIRIPTTVLAQADAAIGVKNGVNAFGKKNFIGTFAPPWAVLNDFNFLSTLSSRDWIAGVAEAVKVALVKDADFFGFIERHAGPLSQRDSCAMRHVIYRCAALHLEHIAGGGDPFELGCSRPLDFGHWSAHKLEQLTGYRLNHGEAVAIGIALDTIYAYREGLLPEKDFNRILDVLRNLGFSLYVPELDASVLGGLQEFREHLGGRLTIMLLSGIGKPMEVHKVDEKGVLKCIEWLKNREDKNATFIEQKSRMPQIQGVKGEAVVKLRRVFDNAVDGI
jgi:3-dehydroquinate synthase